MKKKLKYIALILALALTVLFAAGRHELGASAHKKAVINRKAAGRITIYTSMYEDVIASLEEDIQKQFPNCKIDFVYGGTSQIQARIATEQGTGKLGCDILLAAEPSYSLELKEKGLLHHHVSEEAGNLAFSYDREGYWYPFRVSAMVLAFNPEKNDRNSVPNSFYDFAYNSGIRGAASMNNPLISGTAMTAAIALRDKYGFGYFDALGKQKISIEASSTALSKLEAGEYKVIMVLEEAVLRRRHEASSKLEIIYPKDGAVIIPSTIMIISGSWSANNNIKAAEAITDWFLGPQGQKSVVAGWMHSVRKDFEAFPYGSVPTSWIQIGSMPLNWEHIFRHRDEIQSRLEEIAIFKR